jgi:hypothetical protein
MKRNGRVAGRNLQETIACCASSRERVKFSASLFRFGDDGMRSKLYAISLSIALTACGESGDSVDQSGTMVKTCPGGRTIYRWQDKLYIKGPIRYREVEGTDADVCDRITNKPPP